MTTARQITNAWVNRTLPDIFYEEPEALAEDGMQQEFTIDRIKWSLQERYQSRDDVFVSNGVFLSYDITNGNARVQPDLFIAFGVDAATIRVNLPNFWIWETGKVPDFVMEVASPSTAANDLGRKRDLYARLGVTEYWRFDPTGGDLYGQPLAGERLVDGNYVAFDISVGTDGSQRSHSQLLDVDFYWGGEGFDVLDPATGKTIFPAEVAKETIRSAEEALRAAEAERNEARSRAEQSEARAEQSEARAEQAEAEAARLREQLRRMREE